MSRELALVFAMAVAVACQSQATGAVSPVQEPATSPPVQAGDVLAAGEKPHNEFFEQAPIDVLPPPAVTGAPGESVKLFFEFVPHAKVKVPIYPPAYLQDFSAEGGLAAPDGKTYARVLTPEEQEAGRLAYYEDGPPPAITLPVTIPAGAKAGTYPFSASVHYFYCYDTGGICAKEEARVSGVVDVTGGSGK